MKYQGLQDVWILVEVEAAMATRGTKGRAPLC
jgi:hypothetical protein